MHTKMSEEFWTKYSKLQLPEGIASSLQFMSRTCKQISSAGGWFIAKHIIHWLQLKGEPFDTYDAVNGDEIEAFWKILE